MPYKVLYISYDGMTDPLGQSQVIPYLQKLSGHGYKFTLISFEKKIRFQKLSGHIRSILTSSGIEWKPVFFTKRPPFLSKIYDVWHLKRVAVRLHKKQNFDFVHCRSYVPASAGLKLWKQFQLPFLFDMRGFWVDERVDNGQWNLRNPFFRFFFKRYKKKEREYFKASRHIISLTQKGKEELVNTYAIPEYKVTVIPCCVDLDHFDYRKSDCVQLKNKKQELGIKPDELVVSYLGSLGGWYLEREMLDFFVEMKKVLPASKFLFITQDSADKVREAAIRSGADEKDILVQPALRAEVPIYLALSDISIFFIKNAYSKRASSPTKQGEIMAMGIPLVCNDIGDTGRIVEASKAGLLVREFSNAAYREIINQLPGKSRSGKEQIRAAAFEHYDLEKGVLKYVNVYKIMHEEQ